MDTSEILGRVGGNNPKQTRKVWSGTRTHPMATTRTHHNKKNMKTLLPLLVFLTVITGIVNLPLVRMNQLR